MKLLAMLIGVPLIGRSWLQALLLRVAAFLEPTGVTEASIAGN